MTGQDEVFCFAVETPIPEGAMAIPLDRIVVSLAETVEEAMAKVIEKYAVTDPALIRRMHLHDVLGDFYDCVAELS